MLRVKQDVTVQMTALAVMAATLLSMLLLTSCSGLGSFDLSGEGRGSGLSGPPRDATPVVLEVSQPGIAVAANEKAVLDYSNVSEGYLCVMSNLGDKKVKVLVYAPAIDSIPASQYQYTITSGGSYVTIPLSAGSGTYSLGVYEHVVGDQYSPILSQDIEVTLADEYRPYLYPSQYVNFAAGDAATQLSQELSANAVADVDTLNAIYSWVCQNITYDTEEATTVASGYLPENASTLSKEKGICFDYAVLTASMLRAQRVPARLVIGYAGAAYHAWIDVHCETTGSVIRYEFRGDRWVLMDPTFDAATRGALDLSRSIGNGTDYQAMFYY